MAGYGNRTAPDYMAEDLKDQHDSTRLGLTESNAPYSKAHPIYGSGTTGGAGFGNKHPSTSSSSDEPSSLPTDEFRFGTHQDTAPYSNAHTYGSGSTGGAGYGNKTGSFSSDGKNDSSIGKVMEKVGEMVHSETVVEKGQVKRAESGLAE